MPKQQTGETEFDAALRDNEAAVQETIWVARAIHGKKNEISPALLGVEAGKNVPLEKGRFFSRGKD